MEINNQKIVRRKTIHLKFSSLTTFSTFTVSLGNNTYQNGINIYGRTDAEIYQHDKVLLKKKLLVLYVIKGDTYNLYHFMRL